MTFIVDGADWDFEGLDTPAVEAMLDGALRFVATSTDRDEEVAIGDDFQQRSMHSGRAIWDLLEQDSPLQLRREIVQELTAWLAHARRYADAEEWPVGFEDATISVNGGAAFVNQDIAWAHYNVLAGRPTACLTLGQSQTAQTKTALGSAEVHFVGDEAGRKLFWRDAILLEGDNLASLVLIAPHAYPALFFVEGVLEHANRLSGGYIGSRKRVRETLATLDDWGHWAFTCAPPSLTPDENTLSDADARPGNQVIEKRFAGFGLGAGAP